MPEGMICPHCGSHTSYDPVEFAKKVQMQAPGHWNTVHLASGSIYDAKDNCFFGLARCQSCGKAFPIKGEARDSSDPDHSYQKSSLQPLWPTRYRVVAAEIPKSVRDAMEDASAALGAGSILGSMLAARTAMIRAQRQAKEELELPEASLKALYEAGRVSKFEFDSSDLARRWANYLGHDNPDPGKDLTIDDAKDLYGYVESLLDSLYVKWDRLNKQKEKLIGKESGNKA